MADKPLKSITFPDLPDRYTIPQIDTVLETAGMAADAKATGDELTNLKSAFGADLLSENYINYNALNKYSFASNSERPNFSRYGNIFVIDGTFNVDTYGYIKLSDAGTSNWAKSLTTANNWTKGINFEADHIYTAELTLISGGTNIGSGDFNVRILVTTSTYYDVSYGETVTFTPGQCTASVVIRGSAGVSFSNAVFCYTIKDVTTETTVNNDLTVLKNSKNLAGNYLVGTRIPSTGDLDDYTEDGNYYINTDNDADSVLNMPSGAKAGRLFVMHTYDNDHFIQFYMDTSNDTTNGSDRIWFRRFVSSASPQWRDWVRIITTARYDRDIPYLLSGDYTAGTRIPSTGDLDDYTTDGNYYINTNADANSIGNMPDAAKAGRLFVMHPYGSDRIVQFYMDTSNDTTYGSDRIWLRRYISTASPQWRNWVQIITTAQLDSSTAVLTKLLKSQVSAVHTSTTKMAYSWWVNNRVVDSYGNLYFGYISEDEYCGVGCKFPDGTIHKKDLWKSNDCDDHNAPSVIIVTISGAEYVFVIGSTGHNTDSKINAYIATEPNSITCEFTDRTHTITSPSGYTMKCSYSQAFFDSTNSRIANFFRLKQIKTSDNSYYMIWMCAISDNFGETWTIYRVFATGQDTELYYMTGNDIAGSTTQKRMVLQTNTTNYTVRPLRAGIVDINTLTLMDNSGTSIQKPMTVCQDGTIAYDENLTIANYNDFTEVVPVDQDYPYKRLRILDVWNGEGSDTHLNFLYAKSVQNNMSPVTSLTDWILYRYSDGTTTEIAHLGMPFFRGSCYVTGACFVGDVNHVIYSKNDSSTQDGAHTLHSVVINNNSLSSDKIIKKSDQTIARPTRYDSGNIMYLVGKYREDEGTSYLTWHFGIQFLDSLDL